MAKSPRDEGEPITDTYTEVFGYDDDWSTPCMAELKRQGWESGYKRKGVQKSTNRFAKLGPDSRKLQTSLPEFRKEAMNARIAQSLSIP